MRFNISITDIVSGLGRNSFHVTEGASIVSSKVNSIRGDGAMTPKKRQDGIKAGKSSFRVCTMVFIGMKPSCFSEYVRGLNPMRGGRGLSMLRKKKLFL